MKNLENYHHKVIKITIMQYISIISAISLLFVNIVITYAQPKGFGYAKTAPGRSATSASQSSRINSSSKNNKVNKTFTYSPSSLSYKTWETKTDKARIEYVRGSDGMVDETTYLKCVCLNGVCRICSGLGVMGYGMFQTYCNSCGGTTRCSFCGGSGTKVITKRYRYIDEYYSNGVYALHVTSSSDGPAVYWSGGGFAYYPYINRPSIKDDGNFYSFGGENASGVKTNSFRLSKDYKTLWMGNEEYHIVDKAEYDRLAKISSNNRNGVVPVPSGAGPSSRSSGSSNSSRRGGSSVYTNCTTCNGTGRCASCNGKGVKFNSYSGHDDTCPGCSGSGKCRICYGKGKL